MEHAAPLKGFSRQKVKKIRKQLTCNSCTNVFFVFIPVFLVIYSSILLTQANYSHTWKVLRKANTQRFIFLIITATAWSCYRLHFPNQTQH